MERKYLIDTNIIIYHLNGIQEASKFIDTNFNKIAISNITFIEVLSFNFKTYTEEKIVRKLLNNFEIIDLTKEISEETISIRKTKKIKLPDAIIAGVAKSKKLILVTRNEKDFKNIDIKVLNPLSNL